jgi:hypothetical protein
MKQRNGKSRELNLIYLDTRFIRLLMEKTNDSSRQRWQEFHYNRINRRLIPFSILTTPFKFLEVLGISGFDRYLTKYPFEPQDEKLTGKALAEVISNRTPLIVEKGTEFYRNLPQLSRENFKARIDYMLKERVAKNPFAEFLAHDVMVRFFELDGIEETIWAYLAIDDIQGVLSTSRRDELFCMAQLQTLRDLIVMYAAKWNISFFRLLRSMWVSLEGQYLKPGIQTVVPMKKETDLGDADYVHFAVCGGVHEEQLRRITVLTCDDKQQVETRVKICKHMTNLFANEILSKNLGRTEFGAPVFMPGRVLVCDSTMLSVSSVNVDQLTFQIEYPDGAVRDNWEAIMKKIVAFE